jgi:hypothetical protein
MKIQKLDDGSTLVEFEDENTYYIKKGIDPIDGLINIGLLQQKTAVFLEQLTSYDEFLIPETFFFSLGRKCLNEACVFLQFKDCFISLANDFNMEIGKQQRFRTGKRIVRRRHSDNTYENSDDTEIGKYEVCLMDTFPELLTISNPDSENHEDSEENHQYRIAFTLLRFIYCGVDIKKIEARISELKGYCAFLEKTAPDEYNAYCVLAEKIGFDTEMETYLYYEILNRIEERA